MLEELRELREKWIIMARGIEIAFGENSPAAKSLRECIGDIARIINEFSEN